MAKKNTEQCSLCGRHRKDVKMLIEGVDGRICDSCSMQAAEIVKENIKNLKGGANSNMTAREDLPTPKVIKEKLYEYIIGQD